MATEFKIIIHPVSVKSPVEHFDVKDIREE